MSDQTKAFHGIAVVLAIGLGPALAGLVADAEPRHRDRRRRKRGDGRGTSCLRIAAARAEGIISSRAGACCGATSPSLQEKVQTQTRELREANMRTMPRSGALNRSAFLHRLDEAIARDARIGKPLAFLLVDIEGFKAGQYRARTHRRGRRP